MVDAESRVVVVGVRLYVRRLVYHVFEFDGSVWLKFEVLALNYSSLPRRILPSTESAQLDHQVH